MPFQPANEDHAVVDCKFAIAFDSPLNGKALNHIHSRCAAWTERLPASGMVEMDVGESIVPLIWGPTSKALLYANLRPDGSPVWSMRIGFNELMATCSRYTRWARTWDIARDMLVQVMSATAEVDDKAVAAVALHVLDEFKCSDADYDISATLKRGSWLSDRILSAGKYWHNNSGWFESDDSGNVLNTLNVAISGEEGSYTLGILHQQQLRINEVARPRLSQMESLVNVVEKSMNMLHECNREMLLALVHDDLADAIKLRRASE